MKTLAASIIQDYYDNYAVIARDDLTNSLIPQYYLKAQAKKSARYAGDVKGKTVIDIGVGQGYLLKQLKDCRKIGVDIATEYLNALEGTGIELHYSDAECLSFKNEADIIFMTDILEHVFSPDRALKCAYEAMKAGGKLIARVPYREDISVYRQSKYKFVHLRSFDTVSFTHMIEVAGFKVKHIHYDGFSLNKVRLLQIFVGLSVKLFGFKTVFKLEPFIANLPNFIGRLFFVPCEITAVAIKGAK